MSLAPWQGSLAPRDDFAGQIQSERSVPGLRFLTAAPPTPERMTAVLAQVRSGTRQVRLGLGQIEVVVLGAPPQP